MRIGPLRTGSCSGEGKGVGRLEMNCPWDVLKYIKILVSL